MSIISQAGAKIQLVFGGCRQGQGFRGHWRLPKYCDALNTIFSNEAILQQKKQQKIIIIKQWILNMKDGKPQKKDGTLFRANVT